MAAAKVLSYTLQKPLVGVHHLQAHIMAAFLTETPPEFPFVALVVSGGHTNLYRVDGFTEMALLGRSRDDAAGEAFDKVAKLMALGYPGGVKIEALAAAGNPGAFNLPRPRVQGEPLTFSFSGLKTAVAYRLKQHPEILADAAARARPGRRLPGRGGGQPHQPGLAGHGAGGLLPPGGLRRGGGQPPACARCCKRTPRPRGLTSSCLPRRSAPTTPPWWPPWATGSLKPASAWTWMATSFPGVEPSKAGAVVYGAWDPVIPAALSRKK